MASRFRKLKTPAGKLKVQDIEKVLETEMKQRETALETQLKDAKEKIKAGDNAGAIAVLKPVAEEKCLFPKKAKDAAKELKKLGVEEIGSIPDAPIFDRVQSARIEAVMQRGLIAENAERYVTAERLYKKAHQMDPADPTPLRYLGELYRHHTGEWDKARATFDTILNMPADAVARAVALHGLGKMTIHDGEFKKGLALMEKSVDGVSIGACLSQSRCLLEFGRRSGAGQRLHAKGTRARPERSIQPRVRGSVHGSFRTWRRSVEDCARESAICCRLRITLRQSTRRPVIAKRR